MMKICNTLFTPPKKINIDTFKMMVWNMYLFSNMVTLGIYVKFPGVMIRENCSFLRLEDVFLVAKAGINNHCIFVRDCKMVSWNTKTFQSINLRDHGG